MNEELRKSLRNGIYAVLLLSTISFFWGGLYTEMYLEGLPFNFVNFVLAIVGSIVVGFMYGMIPVFLISLLFYKIKKEKNKEKV